MNRIISAQNYLQFSLRLQSDHISMTNEQMKQELVEIRFPATMKYINFVRLSVGAMGEKMGFSVEDIEDLKIGISEVCINAIQHGYGGEDSDNSIELLMAIYPDRLEMVIMDKGKGFDLNIIEDDGHNGGTGFLIINKLMDEVNYVSTIGSGTTVEMVKHIKKKSIMVNNVVLDSHEAAGPVNAEISQRKSSIKNIDSLFLLMKTVNDKEIRSQIIVHYYNSGLVQSLAKRFVSIGRSLDGLVSVGCIGLINAVDHFDPGRGVKFTTYASHCIIGEIKRHFRDTYWALSVPRRIKELYACINQEIEKSIKETGNYPTNSEIADKLDISVEVVLETMEARHAYKPLWLDNQLELDNNRKSFEELSLDHYIENLNLKELLSRLSNREQLIIQLYYFDGYSQAEIGKRLNISQMHTSRIISQCIGFLRKMQRKSGRIV